MSVGGTGRRKVGNILLLIVNQPFFFFVISYFSPSRQRLSMRTLASLQKETSRFLLLILNYFENTHILITNSRLSSTITFSSLLLLLSLFLFSSLSYFFDSICIFSLSFFPLPLFCLSPTEWPLSEVKSCFSSFPPSADILTLVMYTQYVSHTFLCSSLFFCPFLPIPLFILIIIY